ncbi:inner centromere [Fusarium pseudoanthophilum]|uniref:Inner centromere n=1 Tax=Fusarium pseudoanthophilum TaxID=48495 RepID=A0A8H5P3R9_9HYPO|nr:inner centromere [Fusarium pseudoanthophilum]
MSGDDLTPDEYRRYQAHMRRRERRARAERERFERERLERERLERERVTEERAKQETAEEERAGEQATQPADRPENFYARDDSLPRSSPNYLGIARGWIMPILRCLRNHPIYAFMFITIIIASSTSTPWLKFLLDFLLPVGGSLGGLFMAGVRKLLGLPTASKSQSCHRDGLVLSASGKFLREMSQQLDKKVVEGLELSFSEVFLREVNLADDRLATVTRSIAKHFYDVCRHISNLEKIISSEPSWLASVLQFLHLQYSKGKNVENEAKKFLSTLDHGITAYEKMIKQTRAGHESIRELGNELCGAHKNVIKIKKDLLLEISNLGDTIAGQDKSPALWQYLTRQPRDTDTAALESERLALREKFAAADGLCIYVAFGCSGSLISCSEIRKLEHKLNWNREWSKDTKDNIAMTLEGLHGNKVDWKTAGGEVIETMKTYEAKINDIYYGKA